MISVHVSAVCRVRDGYTGRKLPAASLLCAMDGVPCRPVGKPGGYMVFTNLSHGPHQLSLRCRGYLDEWVELAAGGGTLELDVSMKPGEGYPFREPVTRLVLTVLENKTPAAGRTVWLAAPGPEMKIAQSKVEAGEQEVRIYCKGPPYFGPCLVEDGKHSEIVTLNALEGERGRLALPLRSGHSRSKPLLPAQRYRTGADGVLTAVFHAPRPVRVYVEGKGLTANSTLAEGDNALTMQI